MKEEESVLLSAKLLFGNPGLNFSFIFCCTVVDQRQAPLLPPMSISAWYSPLTAGSHLPPEKQWLFPYFSIDTHNECMTFWSILIDILDTERLFCYNLASSRSSSHTPRSVFASLQPGLAWSSVGSHLTNQPPTGDVFDSSGFLMKWTLSACREFCLLLAGARDPARHMWHL